MISASFEFILQIAVFSLLVFGTVSGYNFFPKGGEWIGAIIGFVAALSIGSLVFGTIFVILEINNNLKLICKKMDSLLVQGQFPKEQKLEMVNSGLSHSALATSGSAVVVD